MSDPHADEPQKQEMLNRYNFSLRLNLFFFIIFIIFTVLIIRLAVLQFVENPSLKEEGERRKFQETPISPLRGTIYDASHTRLAYSTASQSLYFNIMKNYGDPAKKMTDEQKKNRAEVEQLAKQLVKVFQQRGNAEKKPLTVEEIMKRMDLTGRMNIASVPRLIKNNLSKKEVAYFLEHKSQYKGIDIVEDNVRNYHPDTIAVQTVGYLRKFKGVRGHMSPYQELSNKPEKFPAEKQYLDCEDVGVDGIEWMYQNELRGLNGIKRFPKNVAGRIIGPMQQPSKPKQGNDIHLTLHHDVQKATEEAITKTLKKIQSSPNPREYAPNARMGFAVAMEVDTGNVICNASMPDYNPNVWRNGQISSEDYEKIQHSMVNGAIREVFGPYYNDRERGRHPTSLVYLGSTVKPLSVLIGLQERLFEPNMKYKDQGYAQIGRRGYEKKIWNSDRKVLGVMDATRSIAVSSNSFPIDMVGKKLYNLPGDKGLKLWDQYMEAFGLGIKTGSKFPGEAPGLKDYLVERKRGSLQSALAYASIGQQGKYTTLQLAQYAATLANHGQRIKPQFVSKITDSEGKVLKSFGREVLSEMKFDDSNWEEVERGMLDVKVQGFDGFKHSFYRKTGTSEQGVAGKLVENAVLIAYAPAEKPKLAVAVVVPEGGYGTYGAAPIARAIFDKYDEVYGLTDTPRLKKQNVSQHTANMDYP